MKMQDIEETRKENGMVHIAGNLERDMHGSSRAMIASAVNDVGLCAAMCCLGGSTRIRDATAEA
jgi:hypothetical protein